MHAIIAVLLLLCGDDLHAASLLHAWQGVSLELRLMLLSWVRSAPLSCQPWSTTSSCAGAGQRHPGGEGSGAANSRAGGITFSFAMQHQWLAGRKQQHQGQHGNGVCSRLSLAVLVAKAVLTLLPGLLTYTLITELKAMCWGAMSCVYVCPKAPICIIMHPTSMLPAV